MREVTITRWCDPCLPGREPATHERTVLDSTGKPKVLDLCDDHDVPVAETLALADEHGVDPAKANPPRKRSHKTAAPPAAGATTYACEHCPRAFTTGQGLAMHITRTHPEARAEMRAAATG